jgi:hypothetical protein
MNANVNGLGGYERYRQMAAFNGGMRASAGTVGGNSALESELKALEVANLPRETKLKIRAYLSNGDAKDLEDGVNKAADPNFKPKSFGDLLSEASEKLGG